MAIDIQRYVDSYRLHNTGELCAIIIESMREHGSVHLITKEIFSFENNGLYDLLDQLCDFYKWDKTKITVTNANMLEAHNEYCVKTFPIKDALTSTHLISPINVSPAWNREKYYGMFIGRANVTRLRAIHNHLNFKYRQHGLASFHANLDDFVDSKVLLDYLCETDSKWSELKSIKPFSDIDTVMTPPITYPKNFLNFDSVYEKIAIEIVCETNERSNEFGLSEKILRPMLYRRPFLLITGSQFINAAKNPTNYKDKLGLSAPFDFYENLIPNYADCYDGASRSDFVFDRLAELIESQRIDTVLEACADQIEHNYKLAFELINKEKKTPEYFELNSKSWHKHTMYPI
jgi:hypothetical protein